jgi:hypothetical protein
MTDGSSISAGEADAVAYRNGKQDVKPLKDP